jgi:Ras-related protein Rab-1A
MTDEESKREDFEILKSSNLPSNLSFKIIIIGDSGVGKTCLSERATKGTFTGILAPTVGFDFYSLLVKYKDNLIKLEIWDTCGQEAYRSLITSYYKHCYLAIIVYAINKYNFFFHIFYSKKSFQNIPEWIRQCRENSEPNIKLILIGNKNDLDEDEYIFF